MALLGFHIVLSLIAATLFNKFQSQFTLCEKLIYKGLKYYFLPEPPDPNDGRRRKGKNKNEGIVPDYRKQVYSLIMQKDIFSKLSYYPSLVWLVDYSAVSLFVFTCCQIFVYLFPKDSSTNVSVLWTIFSMTFALQILFKLLWKKFTNPNLGAERNLIFSFSLIIFLFFMLMNMFADQLIDENLFDGYKTLVHNTKLLAESESSLNVDNPSPLFLFIFASFLASIIGAAFLMPIVQYASLYRTLIDEEKSLKTVYHHFLFLMPLLILPLFLKPVQEQFLIQMPYLSPDLYAALRVYLVIIWALAKIFSIKQLLQVYLENAKNKALMCSKHADGFETMRSHLSYLCATILQLLAPVIVLLYVSLTLISLGHIFPLNTYNMPEAPDYLTVVLDPKIQRTLWTYVLFSGITLHSFIALITVMFGV